MAVVSVGLLNSGNQITPEHVVWVVLVCLSVNATWGIIDGVSVMFTNVIERAARDRVVYDVRSGAAGSAQAARELIDDSVAAVLTDAGKDRVVAALAAAPAGSDPRKKRYGPGLDDWLYALGIFLIDVGLALPVILPLLIFSDIPTAIYLSRLAAVVIFAHIGWGYARSLNRNPWLTAFILGALGFVVFTQAYRTGW